MAEKDTDKMRGERIANFRKQQNMSQDALADAVEISRPALSKIENGGDFMVSNLLNLVSVLNVTPGQILYEEADGKASLIEDINEELSGMDELELRKLLAGIRAIKGVA